MSYLFKFFLVFIVILSSCKQDFFPNDGPGELRFSNDTILFDTIFTTIGSITKTLKVYNDNNNSINISSIFLAENLGTYKINIDGIASNNTENITIPANDSIYIFLEVKINPVSGNNPYLITDSLVFITNGVMQDVNLIAYGQNAHFYTPNKNINLVSGLDTISFQYHSISEYTEWNNDLPHVVYGYIFVEENSILNINAGTKIFFHKNSGLIIGNPFDINNSGTLKVNGIFNNEVVFKGDRLDDYYSDLAGQWDKIWLSPGSKENEINYAIIENGTVGIHVDTLGDSYLPTLTVNNTIINNMSDIGIFAQGSNIRGINNVVTNCGRYTLVLNIGGNYNFNHCTFANYWNYSSRTNPSILINNYYEDINGITQSRNLDNANFINCIISGNNLEEIELQNNKKANFNYNFSNCLLKIHPDSSLNYLNQENSIKIVNNDSIFIDIDKDFQLSNNSPAINKGKNTIDIDDDIDILNQLRNDGFPDIGAYEKIN